MPASTKQPVTQNFNITLPSDDSHNSPWGVGDKVLADAINTFDTAIVTGVQQNQWCYANDTGAANAYAAAYVPAPPIVPGTGLYFKAVHANTGASTLAVNGGTAKAITKNGGTALAGAEIAAGAIIHVIFDGTEWQLISQ
jgi:hypothetical protein